MVRDAGRRALVLIDGPYLQHTRVPEIGLVRNWIDYAAFKGVILREVLGMEEEEVEFRYYTPVIRRGNRAFLQRLTKQGYPIRKTLQEDVDTFIIEELYKEISQFDTFVIVSGDGGFIGPIKEVLARGKTVKVAAFAFNLHRGYQGLVEIIDLEQLGQQFHLVPVLSSAGL